MRCAVFVIVGGFLGSSRPVRATVVADISVEDMVFDADAIVVATVVDVGIRVVVDHGTPRPFTVVTLAVSDWLKGQGEATVEVTELGGHWAGGWYTVPGTPVYVKGERVVAFLDRGSSGRFQTYSLSLGKFSVRHAVEGPPRAVRDLGDVALARWGSGGMQVETPSQKTIMPLTELLARIRGVLSTEPSPRVDEDSRGGLEGRP